MNESDDTKNAAPQSNVQPIPKRGFSKVLLGIVIGLFVVAIVLTTLLIVKFTGVGGGTEELNKNNQSQSTSTNADDAATSQEPFDFEACIKRNTKPGEDAHIANDKCINEKASAQGGQSTPGNNTQQPNTGQ